MEFHHSSIVKPMSSQEVYSVYQVPNILDQLAILANRGFAGECEKNGHAANSAWRLFHAYFSCGYAALRFVSWCIIKFLAAVSSLDESVFILLVDFGKQY
jgi:hypothetical protein